MTFKELKEDLMGAKADMRSYIDYSDEYLRLRIFKIAMQHITGIAQFLLISIGFIFALLFLSFAACLALSEFLNSYFIGFIIVGGFYALVGILCYLFKKKLETPVLKIFSKYYF